MLKKTVILMLLSAFITHYAQAQTKVFKEVGEGISSQIKTIRQDNTLVGYLMFTRLEKASVDSFNYRITIMDENLNNIGKVDFKDIGLMLKDVSFDQDVLCLGYLKSNFFDQEYKNKSDYRKAVGTAKNFVMLQFISLNGKIINTQSIKASIGADAIPSWHSGKVYADGKLKSPLLVKNISQKGFACFFGDDGGNNLLVFNAKGEQSWQKKLNIAADEFSMLTSGGNIYLLTKKKDYSEGNCVLNGYRSNDVNAETHLPLMDEQGNQLKVLKFDNDIVTGKPYLAGCIINPKRQLKYYTGRHIFRGPYLGVFTLNINGDKSDQVKKEFTYWSNGSTDGVSARGLFAETDSYAMFTDAFRDFKGNTYFAGPEIIRRTRWGSIASAIIVSPIVIPSIWILGANGTSKCKVTDAMLVKQDDKGVLSVENSIPADHSGFHRASMEMFWYNNKSFYTVSNSDTKTNYLIIDDEKNIFIYNVNKKDVVRTIPHKDGNIKTYVYPAKEGSIMVSEYNKKEKYTRISIAAL